MNARRRTTPATPPLRAVLAPLAPLAAAGAALGQCGPWEPGPFGAFASYGTDAPVLALASWQVPGALRRELFVGGEFATLAGGNFGGIARWDGTAWRPLGLGTQSGAVRALLPYGDVLVVGGAFSAGFAQNIARWDGFLLQPMGDVEVPALPTAGIHCIHNHLGQLFIGGQFQINGASVNLAYWNGAAWEPRPINGIVRALATFQNELHAGGAIFGTPQYGLVRWNGSGWTPVGGGIPGGMVYVLHERTADNSLYVGGPFPTVGIADTEALARWDGTNWHAVGGGLPDPVTAVHSLADYQGQLAIGGNFDATGSRNITLWDGASYAPLGMGAGGFSSDVYAMTTYRGSLVVGGELPNIGSGSIAAHNLGQWSGAGWSALRPGANGPVYALLPTSSGFYAGGHFDFTINSTQTAFSLLASNGVEASIVAPTGTSANGLSGPVYALGYYTVGIGNPARLIVGGQFAFAAGVAVSNIVQYDLGGWSNLGGGVNGRVNAVMQTGTIQTPRLIATGAFTAAGGNPVGGIAQWVSGAWSGLGSGLSGGTGGTAGHALAQYGGQTYVGGNFTHAGGTPASAIARWNGSSWSALDGTQFTGAIYALRAFDGVLIAAGSFRTGSPQVFGRIAAWDGTAWTYMEQGLPSILSGFTPTCLGVHEGDLYLGGQFGPIEDPTIAGGVYRWSGSTWQLVDELLNGGVRALTSAAGALWAGGGFTTVSGEASPSLARVVCTAPPACYANCDGSTTAPVLNVADFTCFLQRTAAGESYANCDGSTQAPLLNVADFTCFLQSFAAGCP